MIQSPTESYIIPWAEVECIHTEPSKNKSTVYLSANTKKTVIFADPLLFLDQQLAPVQATTCKVLDMVDGKFYINLSGLNKVLIDLAPPSSLTLSKINIFTRNHFFYFTVEQIKDLPKACFTLSSSLVHPFPVAPENVQLRLPQPSLLPSKQPVKRGVPDSEDRLQQARMQSTFKGCQNTKQTPTFRSRSMYI